MAVVTNITRTFADMKARVLLLTREASTAFSDSEVGFAVNSGLRFVYDVTNRDSDEIYRATVVGQREYDVPEPRMNMGWIEVDAVWIADTPLTPAAYTRENIAVEDYGEPTEYYLRGDNLGLIPIPDAIYSMRVSFKREFKELSGDADEVTLNDLAIDAAMYYAAHILKTIDEEFDSAGAFKNLAMEQLGQAANIPTGIYNAEANPYAGAV